MTNSQNPPKLYGHQNHKAGQKLNWLRAAVLGANDGIISVASIVVGVAGASSSSSFILTAGIAGLTAGALSMGVGEYVSVSTQRDTEKALIEQEKEELQKNPDYELQELADMYQAKGLSSETATAVARELTAHSPVKAHVEIEMGFDPNELTNPWHAAFASAAAFLCGAVIPVAVVVASPASIRIPMTFVAVLIALIITGTLSAAAGEASKTKAAIRVVLGGMLAMVVTFGIGKLFGVSGI